MSVPPIGNWLTPPLGLSSAADRAADLARRLFAPDIAIRSAAVSESLSLAGMATVDGRGAEDVVVMPAAPPAASAVMTGDEVFELARTCHQRGVAYADYADAVYDMGWPGPALPRETAGPALFALLFQFVAYAHSLPGDEPTAVTWLLLEAMSAQRGEMSSWDGSEEPDRLTLTPLEQHLLSLEFERSLNELASGPASDAVQTKRSNSEQTGFAYLRNTETGLNTETGPNTETGRRLLPLMTQPTPCTGFLKRFGADLDKLATTALGKDITGRIRNPVVRTLFTAILEETTDADPSEAAATAGLLMNFMRALSILAKIQRLWIQFQHVRLIVAADPDFVHKPRAEMPGTGEATPVKVTATVGIDEPSWQEYQREWGEAGAVGPKMLRDCFAALGFPVTYDLQDAVWDFQKAKVTWKVLQGDAQLATIDPASPLIAPYETPVVAVSDHQGQAVLPLVVWPENIHADMLPHVHRPVTLQADLSLVPMDWTNLVVVVAGFLTDDPIPAIVTGGSGTLDGIVGKMCSKTATGSLTVEYCQPSRRLHLRFSYSSVGDISQILWLNASGTERRSFSLDAVLIEQQDGSFVGPVLLSVKIDVDGHLGDQPITAGFSGQQPLEAVAVAVGYGDPTSVLTSQPMGNVSDVPPPPTSLTLTLRPTGPGSILQQYGQDLTRFEDVDGVPTFADCIDVIGGQKAVTAPPTDPGGPITSTGADVASGWLLALDASAEEHFGVETEWLAPDQPAGG